MKKRTFTMLLTAPALALGLAFLTAGHGTAQTFGSNGYISGGGGPGAPNLQCAILITPARHLACVNGPWRCVVKGNGRICIQGI